MVKYLLRRIAISVVIVYVVITLTFFLIRLMPGNAVDYLYNQLLQQGGLTPQQIQQQVSAIYGLMPKSPLWQQYLQYIAHVSVGNFGRSLLDPTETVAAVITSALPWTVFVVSISLLVSFCIGLAVGTVMAMFRRRRASNLILLLSSFLNAVPNYLVAIVLLYFLADLHHVFPFGGAYSSAVPVGLNFGFIASIFRHAALPIAAFVVTAFGGWALMMKGSVIGTLGSDYVRTAESWGLPKRRIAQSYVGRNAMLPLVTGLAMAVGYMFGGSVFIETIFSYPGLGYYLIHSVDSRNYPVMMGCFILVTVAVITANLVVDLMYPLIDPRIARIGGEKARSAVEHAAQEEAAPEGAVAA